MTLTELNPRPIWNRSRREESYWKKVQCAMTCSGHIMPFDRSYEVIESQIIYLIDVNQWFIVRDQELQAYQDLLEPASAKKKKIYTPKKLAKKCTKIFGKLS